MDTSGALDHHRMALMKATRGLILAGDGDRTTSMNRGSLAWLTIAARSWPDRHAIVADSLCDWGHDHL